MTSGSNAAREQYLATLREHDWSHEFSDDGIQYRRGRDSLAALRAAQPLVDPHFSDWNEHAPPGYRVHVSADPTQEPAP